MSSEIDLIAMPTPCCRRKAASGAPLCEGCSGSPESLARGMLTKGFPVNPGELPASPHIWAQVSPNPKTPGLRGVRVAPVRSERPSSGVSCDQGNGGAGKGRRAVLRFHSTDEGGEPQGSREGAATISTGGKG